MMGWRRTERGAALPLRAELHRCARCWPNGTQAQLGGVVYVASPVGAAHAQSHAA
jgi:hypothetical protein